MTYGSIPFPCFPCLIFHSLYPSHGLWIIFSPLLACLCLISSHIFCSKCLHLPLNNDQHDSTLPHPTSNTSFLISLSPSPSFRLLRFSVLLSCHSMFSKCFYLRQKKNMLMAQFSFSIQLSLNPIMFIIYLRILCTVSYEACIYSTSQKQNRMCLFNCAFVLIMRKLSMLLCIHYK